MAVVPPYYLGKSGAPAWDFIEDFSLDYYRGCALKYLARAGRKTPDPRGDLTKAIACLARSIEVYERSIQVEQGGK